MEQILQAPKTVLMVRPGAFYPNPDTQACNSFQSHALSIDHHAALLQSAQAEFDNVVALLLEVGVDVKVFQDDACLDQPDAIFPNNWLSTHCSGASVIYPMFSPARRTEKAAYPKIEAQLSSIFKMNQLIDLSRYEQENRFLEGTGVLCIDHINHLAYVGLSNRADVELIQEACHLLSLTPVIFNTESELKQPVYHTNVILSVGTDFALLSADMISDKKERAHVIQTLERSGKEVIILKEGQINAFAGNAIELTGTKGRYLAMSQRGRNCLTEEQRIAIEKYATLLSVDLTTVELSGGSMRCMIAGIHWPKKV